MKTRVLFLITILIFSFPALTYKNGAPSGKTGSPKSNNNTCYNSYCHNGPSASTQTISVSSNIPADGYIPNTDYTFTITSKSNGASNAKMGFESSIEGLGQHQGSLTQVSGSTQIKSSSFITHTSTSNTPNSGEKSWDFIWNSGLAPDSVILYTAGIFGNGNNAPNGDVLLLETKVLRKSSLTLNEDDTNYFLAYPNPAKNWIQVSNSKANSNGFIYVTDLSGKVVLQSDWVSNDQTGKLMDVSELSNGIYSFNLILENGENFHLKLKVLR